MVDWRFVFVRSQIRIVHMIDSQAVELQCYETIDEVHQIVEIRSKSITQ